MTNKPTTTLLQAPIMVTLGLFQLQSKFKLFEKFKIFEFLKGTDHFEAGRSSDEYQGSVLNLNGNFPKVPMLNFQSS